MKKTVAMISVVLGLTGTVMPSVSAGDDYVFQQNYNVIKGTNALVSGEYATASKYLKRALKANIGKEAIVHVLNNLCAAELKQEHFKEAMEFCNGSIKRDRRSWKAHVNRAHIHRLEGNIALAIEDYKRAQDLQPGDEVSQKYLALLEIGSSVKLASKD